MHKQHGRQGIGNLPIRTAKRKNKFKNEGSLRSHFDNIKHTNISIIRVPKEKKGEEIIFDEIMTEKFLT